MTLPIENLDDKIFEDLVREAVSRIPVYAPGWTDRNPTDPGITFIELFAWLAEMQIYRLNRIDEKSYKKFLKLLGLPGIRPPSAARVEVTFSLVDEELASIAVPGGTKVAATDPLTGEEIIFEIEQDLKVANLRLEKILASDGKDFFDNTKANENDNVYYLAFGADPKENDALYLGFSGSPEGQELTLAFYLNDSITGKSGDLEEHTSVALRWEYWGGDWLSLAGSNQEEKASNLVEDETKNLTSRGRIRIKMGKAEKILGKGEMIQSTSIEGSDLFWIRCRLERGSYEIPPRVDRIRLNTISAVQREYVDEVGFSSSGLPGLSLTLEKKPVVPGSLKVECGGAIWTEVEDLDASGPGDYHYTLDPINGRLTFGDGIQGRVPPKGENNMTVSYHCGGGARGNVEAHSICRVLDERFRDLVRVDNEESARGGEGPGTLEEAVARAKRELKEITRAVTSSDYEHLALNTPGLGVARAKAIPRYHPSTREEVPRVVSVVVVPRSPKLQSVPSAGFLRTVYRHLDEHRLLTTELFVLPPDYVKVSAEAIVVKEREHLADTVEKRVCERLDKFLHPTKGGPDGDGWPFGRPVYVSEIFEAIGGAEGVDYVKSATLLKEGEVQVGDVIIPKHGLVSAEGEIFVRSFAFPPVLVKVSVEATLMKKREHPTEEVEEKVRERLKNFFHLTRGGPEGFGWPLGRQVRVSEISEIIRGVKGVDSVRSVVLLKDDEVVSGDLSIPENGLVYSPDPGRDDHKIVVEEGSGV